MCFRTFCLSLLAFLSFLSASTLTLAQTPSPSPNLNSGEDHRAHAVPGGPYVFYDHSGKGSAVARLDASGSHSHYYNPATKENGYIMKYLWRLNKKTICTTYLCNVRLNVSSTEYRVRLTVEDNTGDRATQTARVKVRDGGRPGIRMLIYRGNDKATLYSTRRVKPNLSRTFISRLNFWNPSKFPMGLFDNKMSLSEPMSIRVEMELDIDRAGNYSFRVNCEGGKCFTQLDRRGTFTQLNYGARSRLVYLQARPYPFTIVYQRNANTATPPRLLFQWIPPALPSTKQSVQHTFIPTSITSHRPGAIIPVIHYIRPAVAMVESTLSIHGSSFVAPLNVTVDGKRCGDVKIRNQYHLTCQLSGDVRSGENETVQISTLAGTSNTNVKITVLAPDMPLGYRQNIKFGEKLLMEKDTGKKWEVSSLTSVRLGPDGRYYFGAQWGVVIVAEIENNYQVSRSCASKRVDDRSILDVAFNPAQPGADQVYVSLSTLKWNTNKRKLSFEEGWHNGEIGLFTRKSEDDLCMEYTKPVITGLPVSNYDHGVSKIVFDDHGNLYVTVGSNTNAGTPSDGFGNLPDTVLSGAILKAPILKRGFDGNVKYSDYKDLEKARVISGDVEAYATGLRNSFGLVYHSSGKIYATDNGGNKNYGMISTSCTTGVNSKREMDKLILVKRNRYYGAANRVRGGEECIHRTYEEGDDDSDGSWEKPLMMFPAATTGIEEYTMNTFGGFLKGNLFLSKLTTKDSPGMVSRVTLSEQDTNTSIDKVYGLNKFSGLALTLSPTGNLMMTRVFRKEVAVLVAKESNPGLMVVTSVNPNRGPQQGGYDIIITGWGFTAGASQISVTVGNKACLNVRKMGQGNMRHRELQCTVPASNKEGDAAVVVTMVEDSTATSRSIGNEFRYMKV